MAVTLSETYNNVSSHGSCMHRAALEAIGARHKHTSHKEGAANGFSAADASGMV